MSFIMLLNDKPRYHHISFFRRDVFISKQLIIESVSSDCTRIRTSCILINKYMLWRLTSTRRIRAQSNLFLKKNKEGFWEIPKHGKGKQNERRETRSRFLARISLLLDSIQDSKKCRQ